MPYDDSKYYAGSKEKNITPVFGLAFEEQGAK